MEPKKKKPVKKKKVFKAPPIQKSIEERLEKIEAELKRSRRLHFKLGHSDLD